MHEAIRRDSCGGGLLASLPRSHLNLITYSRLLAGAKVRYKTRLVLPPKKRFGKRVFFSASFSPGFREI